MRTAPLHLKFHVDFMCPSKLPVLGQAGHLGLKQGVQQTAKGVINIVPLRTAKGELVPEEGCCPSSYSRKFLPWGWRLETSMERMSCFA